MNEAESASPQPTDPYWKLRPAGPTPEDEICCCPAGGAIVLQDSLGANPLHCLACNGEVAPERIGFDAQLADDIALWLNVRHALEMLWLDSGEYERWAAERLRDANGSINRRGRAIAARLTQYVPTYYRWFTDFWVDGQPPPSACPICNGPSEPTSRQDAAICVRCAIIWQCQ